MRNTTNLVLATAASAFAAASASAQLQHGDRRPSTMGGPHMMEITGSGAADDANKNAGPSGMMGTMGCPNIMGGRGVTMSPSLAEGRIAYLKAGLGITKDQEAAF